VLLILSSYHTALIVIGSVITGTGVMSTAVADKTKDPEEFLAFIVMDAAVEDTISASELFKENTYVPRGLTTVYTYVPDA
jgi:hypothetical protein